MNKSRLVVGCVGARAMTLVLLAWDTVCNVTSARQMTKSELVITCQCTSSL